MIKNKVRNIYWVPTVLRVLHASLQLGSTDAGDSVVYGSVVCASIKILVLF